MRIKPILSFIKKRRINYSGCADKSDLVDVICEVYKIPLDNHDCWPIYQNANHNEQPSSSLSSNEASASHINSNFQGNSSDQSIPPFPPPSYSDSVNNEHCSNYEISVDPPGATSSEVKTTDRNRFKDLLRVKLSLIDDIEEIDLLSVNQLKQLLAANHMQISAGCKEKEELRQQVRMLYIAEQRRLQQQMSDEGIDWSNTCKICMANEIDCVILDCGHLCCCLDCGKTLNECPMCRALVVRAVRVFKS